MPLSNPEKRRLKAEAQHLEPVLKLGKNGLTAGFLQSVEDVLLRHGLIKIKFVDFKDQKKTLAVEIAEKSGSELIARVGNVAVFYRTKPGRD